MKKIKIFNLLIILILPLFLTKLIYLRLSPSICFSPVTNDPQIIEKNISDHLEYEFNRINDFAPIIQFGNNWFKYDIDLENKFKLAFVNDKTNYYSELTTELEIVTNNATSTIPYNGHKIIANAISPEKITGLITGLKFTSEARETIEIPPFSEINVQTNEKWSICLNIFLIGKHFYFIWFVCLGFVIGIISLIKQMITFIYSDFTKYFKSE